MADLCTEEVKIVEMAPEDITPTIITDTLTEVQSDVPMVGLAAAGAGAGIRGGGGVGAMELGRRLLLAARAGDTALVLDLMAKGAPFTTDWLGTSPLHLAASNDHAATCGVLLRAGVSRDSRTKVERTPLHLAAAAGHTSVVTLLLRHGAAADARDLLRMTPLHWAAQRGHTQVAQTLLKYGADPNFVSKFNKTPMQLAARAGHTELMKLLEDAVRQKEAVRSVQALVEGGHFQVAQTLLKYGADPNFVSKFNKTPMQLAARAGHTELMKLLEDAVRQKEAVRSVQALVEDETEIKSIEHIELPEKTHNNMIKVTSYKVTKTAQTQEKLITEEKDTSKPSEDVTDGSGDASAGAEAGLGAAAILRRHGITLLPPDTGGTVLSALQSGRTVVLSDAGKLMLQESVTSVGNVTVRSPARPTTVTQLRTSPPQVKLIQPSAVRRVSNAAPAPTISKSRPPVKIIMNKSNFKRLVAGGHPPNIAPHPPNIAPHPPTIAPHLPNIVPHPPTIAPHPPNIAPQPPNIAPAPEPPTDDVAELKAQLAASRWTVARLTKELKICRAKLAHYENSASVIYECVDSQ